MSKLTDEQKKKYNERNKDRQKEIRAIAKGKIESTQTLHLEIHNCTEDLKLAIIAAIKECK